MTSNDKMYTCYVADSFTELQMYVVFEFEDSGHALESVVVSVHSAAIIALPLNSILLVYFEKLTTSRRAAADTHTQFLHWEHLLSLE